jgi:hypothetical protein
MSSEFYCHYLTKKGLQFFQLQSMGTIQGITGGINNVYYTVQVLSSVFFGIKLNIRKLSNIRKKQCMMFFYSAFRRILIASTRDMTAILGYIIDFFLTDHPQSLSFNSLFILRPLKNAMNINAGYMYLVGIYFACLYQLFYFCNRNCACFSH